jgi:hypothetical protein
MLQTNLLHSIRFWSEYLKGRGCLEVIGVEGKIILEWILGKYGGKFWTEWIWLMIGNSGRLLSA